MAIVISREYLRTEGNASENCQRESAVAYRTGNYLNGPLLPPLAMIATACARRTMRWGVGAVSRQVALTGGTVSY